jgi:hypothetical protein
MSVDGWQELAVWIVAMLTAVITIVGVAKRWIVDPAARSFRQTIREEIGPLAEKVDRIAYEVQYDSGESLKDKVRDLTSDVAQLRGEIDTVLRFVDPKRPNPKE